MSKDRTPLIAPSLLAADWSRLKEQVQELEASGIKYLHFDVMDGHFVPPITFGPQLVSSLKPHSKMVFDVHLMIENPAEQVSTFVDAGADIVTVHAEASPHLHRDLQSIKESGIKAGVALNPSTPVSALTDIISLVDLVLIMSVNPGWGGQKFIPHSVEKIEQVKNLLEKTSSNALIEVDGGVNRETIKSCYGAGADLLVAGSAVFGSGDVSNNIKELEDSCK